MQNYLINIIIAGVGGQGNILASQILGEVAVDEGYYATIGESYGLSQRGGSVMSHLRISKENKYGPLIPRGRVDVIVGFEPLETLRVATEYAGKDSMIIVNPNPIFPIGVISRNFSYPPIEDMIGTMKGIVREVNVINATELAKEAGNPLAQNVVMIGSLAGLNVLPFTRKAFEKVMKKMFSSGRLEINKKAFDLGVQSQKLEGKK